MRSERHRAKVEVVGAIPAVDAILPGLWCDSSISAREADGPGANPGFLTNFDGPPLIGYRDEFVGDAKAVVVGMTSNGFTLADPNDRGILDVVGFDTTVPAVISDFIRS